MLYKAKIYKFFVPSALTLVEYCIVIFFFAKFCFVNQKTVDMHTMMGDILYNLMIWQVEMMIMRVFDVISL